RVSLCPSRTGGVMRCIAYHSVTGDRCTRRVSIQRDLQAMKLCREHGRSVPMTLFASRAALTSTNSLASKAKDREERRIPITPTLQAILDRRKVGPDGTPCHQTRTSSGLTTGDQFQRRYV